MSPTDEIHICEAFVGRVNTLAEIDILHGHPRQHAHARAMLAELERMRRCSHLDRVKLETTTLPLHRRD